MVAAALRDTSDRLSWPHQLQYITVLVRGLLMLAQLLRMISIFKHQPTIFLLTLVHH